MQLSYLGHSFEINGYYYKCAKCSIKIKIDNGKYVKITTQHMVGSGTMINFTNLVLLIGELNITCEENIIKNIIE